MQKISKYYQLESRKIQSDGEKIELFTDHDPTIGAFREARLREYLAGHVAGSYTVSSGFVSDHDEDSGNISDRSTKQIDCLVYDANNYCPVLTTVDFSIVTPTSVAAIIEIKSDLTFSKNGETGKWQGTLVKALENVTTAIKTLRQSGVWREDFFTGIMAYNATSIGQFVNAVNQGSLLQQLAITDIWDLPNQICIFNGPSFAFHPLSWDQQESWELDTSHLIEFPKDAEGSSLQLFTAEFYYYVNAKTSGAKWKRGGLRSSQGYSANVINHRLALGAPLPPEPEELSLAELTKLVLSISK